MSNDLYNWEAIHNSVFHCAVPALDQIGAVEWSNALMQEVGEVWDQESAGQAALWLRFAMRDIGERYWEGGAGYADQVFECLMVLAGAVRACETAAVGGYISDYGKGPIWANECAKIAAVRFEAHFFLTRSLDKV